MRSREQEMTCKVRPNPKLVPGWATGWLVQATNGNFYGTAEEWGANGDGTVFSLAVGLGPFVETVPTSGKVGRPSEFSGPI
jgi:uncharacterized repeat protein (TIGR03803 family)